MKYRVRTNKMVLWGIICISIMTLTAVVGPFLVMDRSHDINDQQPTIALKPPFFRTMMLKTNSPRSVVPTKYIPITDYHVADESLEIMNHYGQKSVIPIANLLHPSIDENIGTRVYYMGTDRFGRDVLSRLVSGIRLSLLVGLFAVCISLVVGVVLGLMSGYYGGWVDTVVLYVVNVLWSIPTLLLVFAIVLALGRGLGVIVIAIGLTMWVDVARLVRGQTLQLQEELFVTAAKVVGMSDLRIMLRHILPNIIGPLLVIAAANFATAILIEAGLSYLGFGIKPPAPSIGNMLNEHYGYAIAGKPMLALIPAVTIMILVLSMNILGSGLRDYYDVRSSDRS